MRSRVSEHISKISRIQFKKSLSIPRTTKNFNKEKTTDINTEINQILELSDKNFKAAIIKMLQ